MFLSAHLSFVTTLALNDVKWGSCSLKCDVI